MKKFYIFFTSLLLLTAQLKAQAPNQINYQGVARDVSGIVLPNQAVGLRFTVHQGSTGGTIVYRETQTATTNLLGLFTVAIGNGTVVTGTFATIAWSANNEYLQVEMDPTGGTSYLDMGTNQFLSVPYALSAGSAVTAASSPSSWSINGNTGASYSTNYIGTTDNSLLFKVGGQVAGRIETSSNSSATSLGYQALNTNSGTGAVGIGFQALAGNSGTGSVGVGYQALNANTSGNNTAVGYQALQKTNGFTGNNNTAVGYQALQANTSGSWNMAFGQIALGVNTTGQKNVAIGPSLQTNTSGSFNVAVGQDVLNANNANNNTSVGVQSLTANTGGNNTALGFNALSTNTSGTGNTGIGYQTSVTPTTISNATAIGQFAQATASNQVILGSNGNNSSTAVTQVGFTGALSPFYSSAYNAGTTGQVLTSQGPGVSPQWTTVSGGGGSGWNLAGNTGAPYGTDFIGTTDNSLMFKVGGQIAGRLETSSNTSSTSFGYQALNVNTSTGGTAFGYQALAANTSGANTAVGYQAMSGNTGTNNTAVGYQALQANTGSWNMAFGQIALQKCTSGQKNVAIGPALQNSTTGSFNVAVGQDVLNGITSGSNNTAVGVQSLTATSGGNNTGVGFNALSTNSSGSNNTAIGYQANVSTGTLTNATAIGDFAQATASNQLILGSNGNSSSTAITQVGFTGALSPFYSSAYNAGTTGQVLTSQGAGVSPQWTTPAASGVTSVTGTAPVSITGTASAPNVVVGGTLGGVLYGTGTGSAFTGVGPLGEVLEGQGPGLPPTWTTVSALAGTGDNWGTQVAITDVSAGAGGNTITGDGATNPLQLAQQSATNDQVLAWNSAGSTWKPATANVLISGAAGQVLYGTGSGLASAYTTGGSAGQVLQWNASGVPSWVTPAANGWALTGNTGTTYGTSFIGTTDNSLMFKVGGQVAGRIETASNASATTYGYQSGSASPGSGELAIGFQALQNSTGIANSAAGYQALASNTSGTNNTAFGYQAAKASNSSWIIAFGQNALFVNTSGTKNAAFGPALQSNTTGSFNVGIGQDALDASNTNNNTAVGVQSLTASTGANNTALGFNSLSTNSTGANNTGLGYQTSVTPTTISNATAVGAFAQATASNQVILGSNGNNSSTAVTQVGFTGALSPFYSAAYNAGTTGQVLTSQGPGVSPQWTTVTGGGSGWGLTGNTGAPYGTDFIGTTDNSLMFKVGGQIAGRIETSSNASATSLGYQALNANTALGTTGFGYQALQTNTSGVNTAVGYQAMQNNSGTNNTAVGYQALQANTGSWNMAFGQIALQKCTSGQKNVAIGPALQNSTTGSFNVAIGQDVLNGITSGSNNTAVGVQSLTATSGSQNTGLGFNALSTNSTGSANTAVGYQANVSTGGLINATAIGANATVTASNSLVLGSSANVGIGTGAPNSTLQVVGGVSYPLTTTTGNLTLTNAHHTVVITGGTPTITLPAALGNAGRMYVLVNETASPVTVTSYQDFTGTANTAIPANVSIILQTDGTNWYLIR